MKNSVAVAWLLSVSLLFASSPAYSGGGAGTPGVPAAVKARLDTLEIKLKNIESVVQRIEAQKMIKEGDAEALDRSMNEYAEGMRAAFDAANNDAAAAAKSQGKEGNVEHLRSFEATAKAHEQRTKALDAKSKGVQAQLKAGTVKLDRSLLQKMTPAQREEFKKHLDAPGLREMERTHPDLFKPGARPPGSSLNLFDGNKLASAMADFCSLVPSKLGSMFVGEAEAFIAAPCVLPCGARNWSACASCVSNSNSLAIAAYNTFKSCSSNCGTCAWYRPWGCLCKTSCLAVFVAKLA